MTRIAPHAGPARPVLTAAADAALRRIPPVWPLASSVAVNPFLGQTTETLAEAGARLSRVGGLSVTMSRDWYDVRIKDGLIAPDDLDAALTACAHPNKPDSPEALVSAARVDHAAPAALPTVAELAAEASGTDWPAILADRFGVWAAARFDAGQALWKAPQGRNAWASWRAFATHDLTPEILGLRGFGLAVQEAPEDAGTAIARAVDRLGVPEAALESYFHQLLFSLGGWAQYARYLLWQAELSGGTDDTLVGLLAIRITWEAELFSQCGDALAARWSSVLARHSLPVTPDPDQVIDAILQDAAERAAQRDLAQTLAEPVAELAGTRPAVQAAFCIDVRSEVFRRALESLDPAIHTLGFAGFFGVRAGHRGFASDVEELRLPVLLTPTVTSTATAPDQGEADLAARYAARAKRAWGRFKLAAVSSFSFVEAMGPVYGGKLVRDSFGLSAKGAPSDPAPRLDPALDLDARTEAAETVLRAMSLTQSFARLVLLAGHGANVVNNPHASGLHCGACGGYSGEVNARLLAGLLNDVEVRAGLAARGIEVPQDTLFVAGLHDTTTDAVTLYDADAPAAGHAADLATLRAWLADAGRICRGERALRLPGASGTDDVAGRSRNWAEVRPEWGLAGCKAFIAAPRGRTVGRKLEGRAFLHDYDWTQDAAHGFGVLELVMTAPVVVASWISLQYYGSTVAPQAFGGGNKLLHNVVGGIGVLEGNGGNLRAGLPLQSVHDGERFAHEPLRLTVCIEAPRAAMTDILSRHPGVRVLFDNGWLHLFRIDEQGHLAERYIGDLTWEEAAQAARQATKKVA